jgi:hypothetical protein
MPLARVLLALALLTAAACQKGSSTTFDCHNFVRDGNETDIDCGGPMCTACGTGKSCRLDRDCLSKLCNSDGVCSAASCSDGVKNGSETDIDCGGPDCNPCATGKQCSATSDCRAHACNYDAGTCE